jgi:hypothetical protein
MTDSEITKQNMQEHKDHYRLDSSNPRRINGKRVIWSNFQTNLKILQIYNKGLEYSVLSDKYETCNPLVWCKDFLHDVVHSSLAKRSFEIYRLRYDPSINHVLISLIKLKTSSIFLTLLFVHVSIHQLVIQKIMFSFSKDTKGGFLLLQCCLYTHF